MVGIEAVSDTANVPMFALIHRHDPADCPVAYAAWRGFASPLRHRPAMASCSQGAHRICWTVEAPDPATALALLPPFVADRTNVDPVREVSIP
jgi:hypothetical protein